MRIITIVAQGRCKLITLFLVSSPHNPPVSLSLFSKKISFKTENWVGFFMDHFYFLNSLQDGVVVFTLLFHFKAETPPSLLSSRKLAPTVCGYFLHNELCKR